ncbi:MAG: hypothetical protein WAQ56_02065, partial [Candidatus Nitrotoga sp.]
SEHIQHWWRPHGFTNTTFEMNVRVDGLWRYIMHAPANTDGSPGANTTIGSATSPSPSRLSWLKSNHQRQCMHGWMIRIQPSLSATRSTWQRSGLFSSLHIE